MRRAFTALALLAIGGGVNDARPLLDGRSPVRVVVVAAPTHFANADAAAPRAGGGSVWITTDASVRVD